MEQVLINTQDQVLPGGIHLRIDAPHELISPLPTLPAPPEPIPLLHPKELSANIMEHEEAGPEKQAHVEEIEMAEAEPAAPAAEAAAATMPVAGAEIVAAAAPAAGTEAAAAIEAKEVEERE